MFIFAEACSLGSILFIGRAGVLPKRFLKLVRKFLSHFLVEPPFDWIEVLEFLQLRSPANFQASQCALPMKFEDIEARQPLINTTSASLNRHYQVFVWQNLNQLYIF